MKAGSSAELTGKGEIRRKNVEAILCAAEKEFVKHGFKGTTMQAIADQAGLPKANLHYYFKNKHRLYNAVLENIVNLWKLALADIKVDDDPAEVLGDFIRKKIDLAFSRPIASKLFALEIIQGAPHLEDHLRTDLRRWVKEKAGIITCWAEQGKIKSVDPVHLIFLIWSSTQHYADFDAQILTITNKREFEQEDRTQVTEFLTELILTGCGLKNPRKQ